MKPTIVVLKGGISSERSVSLNSGEAVLSALKENYPDAYSIDLKEAKVPEGLSADEHIVFSVMHGTFGEDGQFQRQLDDCGIQYTGCDALSSERCMDKALTKNMVSKKGVPVIPGLTYSTGNVPTVAELTESLGEDVVFKPSREGSSVGLAFAKGEADIQKQLSEQVTQEWVVEKRVYGRELTVGVLDGKAMGVVEIIPDSGVYDYESKYTPGSTRYEFPAKLNEAVTHQLQKYAEQAFHALGCRDYARIDFLLTEDVHPWFLEINTLPGLTATSLLPKSASCIGLSFPELAQRMVEPALKRYHLHQTA
jgi:D-alanine-D-alanine ligase